MMNVHDPQAMAVQRELQRLFDSAAAKSLVVASTLDAEEEMARFLHAAKCHLEQRTFVARLFIESFSDSSWMKWPPSDFLQFCMHELRWPEIQDFIRARKNEDIDRRGAARSGVWDDILAAFEDNWDGANYFETFKHKRKE